MEQSFSGVSMIYEKCRDILLRECETLQEAAVIQEKIRAAVLDREWELFQEYMKDMSAVENKMVSLENEREQLFNAFDVMLRPNVTADGDPKSRFYAMASILPENQRNELTSIYRSLKMEVLKLHMANETLMTYLAGIRSTINEFFDLAFPERSVKTYSQQGMRCSNDMRSMVLNHSF